MIGGVSEWRWRTPDASSCASCTRRCHGSPGSDAPGRISRPSGESPHSSRSSEPSGHSSVTRPTHAPKAASSTQMPMKRTRFGWKSTTLDMSVASHSSSTASSAAASLSSVAVALSCLSATGLPRHAAAYTCPKEPSPSGAASETSCLGTRSSHGTLPNLLKRVVCTCSPSAASTSRSGTEPTKQWYAK